MIELYPLSTMALSLADVEHYSPASLWVCLECFVQARVEETDLCFVFKTDIDQ